MLTARGKLQPHLCLYHLHEHVIIVVRRRRVVLGGGITRSIVGFGCDAPQPSTRCDRWVTSRLMPFVASGWWLSDEMRAIQANTVPWTWYLR